MMMMMIVECQFDEKFLSCHLKENIESRRGWRVSERERKKVNKNSFRWNWGHEKKLRRDAKGNCFLQSYLDQFYVWVDELNESTMWPNCW